MLLDVHYPLFAWLVEHSADVLTKCSVGSDGRTPYERIETEEVSWSDGGVREHGHGQVAREASRRYNARMVDSRLMARQTLVDR